MTRAASPTVRRRELAAQLRRLRLEAGLGVEDVAAAMEVSAAKISRIETASRGVSAADIRFLCDLYQVSTEQRDHLLLLTREAKRRSWWQEYDLPDAVSTYTGLEAAAVSIHQYETSLVPPLLQTEDYARAVTAGTTIAIPAEQVDQRVQARLTRQGLLTADQPPELWTIVDETALHRLVGGQDVMRHQLEALSDQSRQRAVTIQVIPLTAGAHPGMDSAFTILHLEEVSDVVYVEGLLGRFFLQHPNDIARYGRAFDELRAIALSPRDSTRLLTELAERLSPR